jgi:hypothetical protein
MHFILLILASFSLSASTLDLENHPISIPISFKPYLDAFKWAVEEDENGQSIHTLREVKDVVDPIKDNFLKFVRDPKLLTYYETLEETVKKFENKIDERRSFLSSLKHTTFEEKIELAVNLGEIRQEALALPRLPLSSNAEDNLETLRANKSALVDGFQIIGDILRQDLTEEERILLTISATLSLIGDGYTMIRKYGYDYGDFSRGRAGRIITFSQDILDQYCPLALQKLLFPFYMIESFQILYNCSNLIFDCVKEECYSLHSDERPTFDVTDKLDKPFFEAFDVMHKKISGLSCCSKERLFENFLFIYNNHVQLVPFF